MEKYFMKRTQIYLDEEIYSFLRKESSITGKSISEIIRDTLKEKLNKDISKLIKSAEEVFGIWSDKEFDTNEYIRSLRTDRVI
jgi:hypothetical protein